MHIETKINLILEKLDRLESMLENRSFSPLAVDIKEASNLIGIGQTNTRKLYKTGKLIGHHEGKKIMILMKSIEDYLAKIYKGTS